MWIQYVSDWYWLQSHTALSNAGLNHAKLSRRIASRKTGGLHLAASSVADEPALMSLHQQTPLHEATRVEVQTMSNVMQCYGYRLVIDENSKAHLIGTLGHFRNQNFDVAEHHMLQLARLAAAQLEQS